jgi:hypothetical protein
MKKIGHNSNRDPYPWNDTNKLTGTKEWKCCDMKLPSTFYICPICEKERTLEDSCLLSED